MTMMADESVEEQKVGGAIVVGKTDNLTEEEWKGVEEFISAIESESIFDDGEPVDEETAIKFLMARKFQVQAAVNTYRNNQITYKKFSLNDMKPGQEPLLQELQSGKFTVLEGKDKAGAAVCVFTASLHHPKEVSHATVMQSLIFQLDEVMKSFDAQRNGLTLIYNMEGAGYGNFDFDLSMKVLSLLKGGYPARLKHVYIVSAPFWFRASLIVLSSFLKEKIRDRVELVRSGEELVEYIPADTLPCHLGGSAVTNHKEWLAKCMETFETRHDNQARPPERTLAEPTQAKTPEAHDVRGLVNAGFVGDSTPVVEDELSKEVGRSEHDKIHEDANEQNSELPLIPTLPETRESEVKAAEDLRTTTNDTASSIVNSSCTHGEASSIDAETSTIDPAQSSEVVDVPSIHRDIQSANLDLPLTNKDSSPVTPDVPPRKMDSLPLIDNKSSQPSVEASSPKDEARTDVTQVGKIPPKKPKRTSIATNGHAHQEDASTESKDLEFKEEEAEAEEDTSYTPEEFIDHMREVGREGIYSEYRHLRTMPPMGQFLSTRHPVNLKKNRYSDVLAFEHSRVRLSRIDDDPFSDYINANFVDGYNQPRAYICTQGPMNNTYKDFWRMVWEQRVMVIVMITKCIERERIKCGQYWPDNERTAYFDTVKVTHKDTLVDDDYTIRQFHLEHLHGDETRTVTQFQFTSWPDFGVLSSPEAFHEVLEQVRSTQAAGLEAWYQDQQELPGANSLEPVEEPPIVVHCSAGIGRTGTFCCTDMNMRMMSDKGRVDIFNTVRVLREQRAFSVQTPAQYEFCHLAVISHMIKLREEQGLDTQDLDEFVTDWYSQPPPDGK